MPTVAAIDLVAEFGTSTITCPQRHSCDPDLIRDCSEYMSAGFDQRCPLQVAHAFAVGQAESSYTEAAHLLGVHANYLHRLIRNLNLKAALRAASERSAD